MNSVMKWSESAIAEPTSRALGPWMGLGGNHGGVVYYLRIRRRRSRQLELYGVVMSVSSDESPFPGRLKDARDARGLSQLDLAQKSGLQPSAISHFETGGRKPSFDNLQLLADVLEVSTDYLLGRTVSMAPGTDRPNQFFSDFHRLSATNQEVARSLVKTLIKNQVSTRK